ncbi:hypothetical protein EDB80DRAFT_82595 [Ilyonectria destructans]|nr:hypothetical protein EDB80DRAFT_82595 [Ilyonectria destructans]
MPLPSHAVIALSACLPVLAICTYLIRWYRDRRKNNELEQEPGDEPDWDRWLTPVQNKPDATSEANLHRPMTALTQSSKGDETRPILLKPLPEVLRRLHIAIYSSNPHELLRMMAIGDPMHAMIPEASHVVYSFYFNPVLMTVNQAGGLEEIVVTKFKSRSINRFRAMQLDKIIEADIDGIIYEGLTSYQTDMVDRIARPQEFVPRQEFVESALVKLTEEILGVGNSASG